MRRAITLVIIFFVSSIVALLFGPSADPITYYMNLALVLCVAIPCYFVGLRHGRMPAGTWNNAETQNAANTRQPQSPPASDQPKFWE